METLIAIVRYLGLDPRLEKLISGEVQLPAYIDDMNPVNTYWYPHPPCLIPLFLGYGASYKAVVHHFFCDRETSYVDYQLENGYMLEKACTFDQWLTAIVIRMIIIEDDLTPGIIRFCEALDYDAYEAVNQFTLDHGDDPHDFHHLAQFKVKPPFAYLKDAASYDGDYPSSLYVLNDRAKLDHASVYEIAVPEKLSEMEILPSWLRPCSTRQQEFDQYLNENKWREAWLTLNAKEWRPADLVASLSHLNERSEHVLLDLVTKNWIDGWKRFHREK